ncbi:hypothetical protein [Pseudovibrio sp. SPO723]|uniref:hypothetical protein n=1 Tax=Nesiotobacter zosterae TaxID=392721 RepID=UPI0029C5C5A2|nr:hypothetical protein [Pseudovibrio sp. SPO723]MDX5595256.1 hypothetical protein [Pseudovibrio sp. SPO723]
MDKRETPHRLRHWRHPALLRRRHPGISYSTTVIPHLMRDPAGLFGQCSELQVLRSQLLMLVVLDTGSADRSRSPCPA